MIYAKKNFIPQTQRRYEQAFEFMFIFSKGKPNTFNPILQPSLTAGMSKNFKRAGYPRDLSGGAQRRRDETITVKPMKIPGNIFYYGTGSNKTGHPAPFPDQLAEDQIATWTNPGDIVYDCCAGSGTTAKAAITLGRRWFVSEISDKYCHIGEKRIFEHYDFILEKLL